MINSIRNGVQGLKDHKYVKGAINWSKKYPLPGAGGTSIFDIGKFIYEETKKDNLTTRSNSIAFSLFISIFPFIIFLFTLLPYLPFTADYTNTIATSTKNLLPKNAHTYLMSIIHDITNIKREGLLSLGFFFALYFSSGGVLTLMKGFDKTYHITFKNRSMLHKNGIAILLTLLLGVLFLFSIALVILGRSIFGVLSTVVHNDSLTEVLYELVRWLAAYGILYLGINIIYYFGPSLRKNLPFVNPGCIVASTLSLLTSVVFAYFVNNFGQYNELYGSIGALLVVLLWLKINAFILLAGFELNASIAVNRDLRIENLKK